MNEAELQQKIENVKAKNMRMREELAAIREEHNYWRVLYHTAAVNAMQGLLANTMHHKLAVEDTARKARRYARELIRQLKEEESSQKL